MEANKTLPEWNELKGKIKAQWSRLGDTDVSSFKDNMHLITEKIQKVYGISKEKAEKEYADFRTSLDLKVSGTEKQTPN